VDLSRDCDYFICPPNLNASVDSDALLKHQAAAFYSAIGVQELDETAMFDKFVLPNFASMPPARRVHAVQHIRRYSLDLRAGLAIHVTESVRAERHRFLMHV
jgi:hypothetical protein